MVGDEEPFDVLVVGSGPAGLGVGVALKHAGVSNFQILDRGRPAQSFSEWPSGMQLITPSFPANSIVDPKGWHLSVCCRRWTCISDDRVPSGHGSLSGWSLSAMFGYSPYDCQGIELVENRRYARATSCFRRAVLRNPGLGWGMVHLREYLRNQA
jgi:2-polyprenyl-6-methoxyphenol hydroxylase-like FAD-dependent oxidoreductase